MEGQQWAFVSVKSARPVPVPPPPPPAFREDQLQYLRQFNFEALLRKYPQCQYSGNAAAAAEKWKWSAKWEGKIYCDVFEMRIYKQLLAIAESILKQTGHCVLQGVVSHVAVADNDKSICSVSVHVDCILIITEANFILEAIHRDNIELLIEWLKRPELVTHINECNAVGDTPLGYVLGHMSDMRVLTLLLDHGALPTMSSERFARYNTSYRRPVVRRWRAHVRMLTLLMLGIGSKRRRRHRNEYATIAHMLWQMRKKYK